MEADLARWYHIDYRDRWRFDDGRRRLTLRRLLVLIMHLPSESALHTLHRGDTPHLEVRDVLLAHIWQATAHSKQPHPLLKQAAKRPRPETAEHTRRVADARRRARQRRHAIEAGEIT